MPGMISIHLYNLSQLIQVAILNCCLLNKSLFKYMKNTNGKPFLRLPILNTIFNLIIEKVLITTLIEITTFSFYLFLLCFDT